MIEAGQTGKTGKTVAIIGASADRRKFGNRAIRAFRRQGYNVIPINPHEPMVEGVKTYASVLDVPGDIDMATFYVPPEIGQKVITEVAQKGIPEVWLNPGSESDELIRLARALKVRILTSRLQTPGSALGSRPGSAPPLTPPPPGPILPGVRLFL
jgi:predicted CoA-binding protein